MSQREAQLEHIANRIREEVLREPGESVEGWARRTWRLTVEEYEVSKPRLPRVEEAKKRTARLVALVGKPEQESEQE